MGRIWLVHNIGRHPESNLELRGGDDLEVLTDAVVVRRDTAIVSLPLNVIAKFLLASGLTAPCDDGTISFRWLATATPAREMKSC
jgi:hypothetical protein